MSFWVRSSVTGTFGGAIRNSGASRSYPFTYTINAANTFEQKTITIAGDTSGTWLTTNGVGIQVIFSLGMGPTYIGTAGAWASADYLSATGATNVIATNGATFYITGVQLEVGTVATSFDYRSYGAELALCQRYYMILVASGVNQYQNIGAFYTATRGFANVSYKVNMRVAPTIVNNSLNLTLNFASTSVNGTISGIFSGTQQTGIDIACAGATSGYAFSADISSGSLAASAEL